MAALARARGFVLDELMRSPQTKVAEVQIPATTLRRSARVVMLHSFVKKTDKTPAGELKIARNRMKEI